MYYYLIALLIFVIDQVSKWLIVRNFDIGESKSIIGDFFHITSQRNNGAAFSILEGQRWFFLVITVIVVVGIIYILQKIKSSRNRVLPIALSFVLGGAVGNFLDRALYGEVVDFLRFHFSAINYTFATFNLADSAIVCGAILIIIDTFRTGSKEKQELKQKVQ
ncbi:signal peptidase II [Paenibacillus macquariensis]|uniref:Lipoprotein signal peptidase n=1 Tax=Paenibacillus macquariensis TaxID=948756 RepID=A0ABY1JU12_9BACL|nr:signal peptidase II [Paenibacillus macquariensis]MEC0091026.1 signal peptidase II [Paenibacillus macquariensis]OAB34743.1 signal peptidase II [Paenibacillus macquariensis subsp. macquariensis]SIQ78265.1 signal peptidase II Aspartic peptidase. MEROPS family A08 [Paenibacillus macquariensis]